MNDAVQIILILCTTFIVYKVIDMLKGWWKK